VKTVPRALALGARAWRGVVGRDSAVERYVLKRYRRALKAKVERETGETYLQWSGGNFVVVKSTAEPEPKVGIFLRGGCDLPSIFVTAPLIRQQLRKGSVAIYKGDFGGQAGASRSDQILQTLQAIPEEHLEEGRRKLRLGPDVFKPHLFDPDPFEIEGLPELGRFPKDVIVLSVGSDLARSLYRHREHGYLVDLGGWWLNQSLEKAIADVDVLTWFRRSFISVGRITVDEFRQNLEQIIRLIRSRVGAHVIVLNSLVIDPLDPTHNYRLLPRGHTVRRRQFHLALAELSARLDFHILDVDRILKGHGVREQVDFAHFPVEGMLPIAEEAHRILRDLEVLP
jgi:hypothetical protein